MKTIHFAKQDDKAKTKTYASDFFHTYCDKNAINIFYIDSVHVPYF